MKNLPPDFTLTATSTDINKSLRLKLIKVFLCCSLCTALNGCHWIVGAIMPDVLTPISSQVGGHVKIKQPFDYTCIQEALGDSPEIKKVEYISERKAYVYHLGRKSTRYYIFIKNQDDNSVIVEHMGYFSNNLDGDNEKEIKGKMISINKTIYQKCGINFPEPEIKNNNIFKKETTK
jgi:hypothetical protein